MILVVFNDVGDASPDQSKEGLEAPDLGEFHDVRKAFSLLERSRHETGRVRVIE